MESSLATVPAHAVEMLTTEQLKSAWLRGERVEFGDPTLARTRMPFHETYYPLGFPVTISTNSLDVLEAATQNWGHSTSLFSTAPLEIYIGVTASEAGACPPTPVCRVRDHLSTNIADSENFATIDHSAGRAFMWVTTAALRHRDYFRYFFLDSVAMCGISSRYATAIHGGCVAKGRTGILLCGDSGAGKTTLSYACARAGWTYVTDDGSYLVHDRDDRLVVGNRSQVRFRPSAEALFPELQGRRVLERAGVGKPSVEMFTRERPEIATSNLALVQHIVFLRRDVQKQELAVFPTAVARLYMMQRVHCLPCVGSGHAEAINHLLRLGALELRYNDLQWAVDRLSLLADEER